MHKDRQTYWQTLAKKNKVFQHRYKFAKESRNYESIGWLNQIYTVVPLQNASGNGSITCKKFHVLTLVKELGVIKGNRKNNKIYETINQYTSENGIFDKHRNLLNRCRLCVNEENNCLFYI